MTISQDTGEDRPAESIHLQRKERFKIIALSVFINGLIVLVLFLIAFPPMPNTPPVVLIAVREPVKPPVNLENQTFQKMKRFIDDGSSSAGMVLPITAVKSPVSIEVPEFDAGFGGMPGLLSGFGDGDGNGSLGRGGDGFIVDIGGMEVRAIKLGVILDVSGSMKEELPVVRSELRRHFANATNIEVNGCNLRWNGPVEFDLADRRRQHPFQFSSVSTLRAVEMLIAHKDVDAIYWYSDLRDDQDEPGLTRLIHLLGLNTGSERRPIRFYLHSVQKKPSEVLKEIVKRSGGQIKIPDSKR